MRAPAITMLAASLLTGGSPHAASPATDTAFAEILRLEDHRTLGPLHGAALLSYLAPGQPKEVRVRAALAVGRIGAPIATPYHLIAAMTDTDPELRRMAVFALGEMDDIKAAPLLALAAADSDPQVRALAAEALGKLKDPASAPALGRLLDDPDAEVAGMALLALWKLDTGNTLPVLVGRASEIYTKGSGELRRRAAYFLMRSLMGHPDDAGIEEALIAPARDADPLIRSYAARGLGASRSARATEILLRLADDDDDWRVVVNAFNGLKSRPVPATTGGKSVWEIYAAALTGGNKGVALAALAALETCEAPQAREHLIQALGHARARFREVATLALAARDKKAALQHVRSLSGDPQWSVRARLAEALAIISPDQPEPDLLALAEDPEPRVRSVVIESLGKIGGPLARQSIDRALKDGDLFVRAAALDALPQLASPGGAAEITALLEEGYARALADPQNDARLSALGSLVKSVTDAARAAVEKALDDPDYLVRRRAAELLRDNFKLDRWNKVGSPASLRSGADYLEAVRRAGRRVTATLDTEAGKIEIELFPADAPLTVDNFIRLARDGKLNGLALHRVVPNFVIQDGDPRGDGNGGPPWQIRCEINLRRYGEGAVGMALSGKDTGGSQYFITHSPQPHLDGGYTIFGQVVSGQDVVNRIVQGDGIRGVTIVETEREEMVAPPVRTERR